MKIKNILLSTFCLSLTLGALVSCGSKKNPNSQDATSVKTSTKKVSTSKTSTSTNTSTSTSKNTSTSKSTSTTQETGPVVKEVEFGSYPQALVDDLELIDELNDNVELPTLENFNGWSAYNYICNYKKVSGEVTYDDKYMFYIDIDLDEDLKSDYRGVYFNKYRPLYINDDGTADNSLIDDNGYEINNVYWFKYEPISWTSITEDNKTLLISNNILSSGWFKGYGANKDAGIYLNNYEYSDLRLWFNNDFYNTAFTEDERDQIPSIEIDNSAASTGKEENKYACNNTTDKIFALSVAEFKTYNKFIPSNKLKGTDYAKCQGLDVSTYEQSLGYSRWALRSPIDSMDYRVYVISENGSLYTGNNANETSLGYVPALYLTNEE